MRRKAYYGYTGPLEFSPNAREFVHGALRVDSNQRALELLSKICGWSKLIGLSYRRNNNRIDCRVRSDRQRSSFRWRKEEQFRM